MEELLKDLVEERGRVWHQGKEVLDRIHAAVQAKESPAGEDEQTWSRISDELDKLDDRIDGLNQRLEREALADAAREKAERFIRPDADRKPAATGVDKLRAWATDNFGEGGARKSFEVNLAGLRSSLDGANRRVVQNVLTEGTGSAGGDTVPTGFREQLYEHLIENTAIRQTNVEVLTRTTGENLLLPKTTAHTGEGTIVAEGGTIQADDPTVGQATLSSFKYPRLVQLSSELIQDTAVDLVGYLARSFGQALANGSGADFIVGTGSGEPTGILSGASVGVTGATAQSGVPSADELIDLQYAVIDPHASRGWWIMRRQTAGRIRKLKNSNGDYIWAPGLAVGAPNNILDRPYVTDPNMPAAATSATSVAFGDFSAYVIGDVGAVRFERSDDFAFDQDLVTYRAILRTGGVPVGSNGEWQVYVGSTA